MHISLLKAPDPLSSSLLVHLEIGDVIRRAEHAVRTGRQQDERLVVVRPESAHVRVPDGAAEAESCGAGFRIRQVGDGLPYTSPKVRQVMEHNCGMVRSEGTPATKIQARERWPPGCCQVPVIVALS